MGTVSGEELAKWDKMPITASGAEERILVLVRLRPLSDREILKNEVSEWECINDSTILFRNSLQERSGFPSAYSFDRVFRGDCSTRQVYEAAAKEVVLSVMGGINSTIFAYGQTSSGKTYTMIGITEYTVADIYDYMHRHDERAFVLKFSAMEIYNEVVRDLLSTDRTPLRILDDPEKGTIVEKLREEILRDRNHLKELLSTCEAQRQTGETSLNESSSRSHQILRLTIESSAREFLGKDKSATLSASVNLVDLAGSERASQALSVGTRLKEGCHINRSLLTLGTVIRKLSKGRLGHINYRDSKLTRILQPSLGGNAKTAIVCTLCPARCHVEQSRNTLLFASCAKEVSTNAHVNVVMSDKALVKHLQQELARLESELRTPAPTSLTCDFGVLLRKKDLQIERMENEMKELTKQRDLAESRVEDLLRIIENDRSPGQLVNSINENAWQAGSLCGDEYSESSGLVHSNCEQEFHKSQCFDMDNNGNIDEDHHEEHHHPENGEDHCISEITSLLQNGNLEECTSQNMDDTDNLYKDVQCIEVAASDEGQQNNNLLVGSTGRNEEQAVDAQNASPFLLPSPYFNEPSPWAVMERDRSCRNMKLRRSLSCGTNFMASSPPPCSGTVQENSKTPFDGLEKLFPGRPEGVQGRFPLSKRVANFDAVCRNDSQSSVGSALVDVLNAQQVRHTGDEDITSVHTFVSGLKEMAELHYEKRIDDVKVEKDCGKSVKDVGLDPMQDSPEAPRDWASDFERQQQEIIELWQTCNVPLVHRTYFLLLFKGDLADSVYLEVELRRLSFLKEKLSQASYGWESTRNLRRERETLCRLMRRRFSNGEREGLYRKWGIALETKRRRLQLVQRLWSETEDPGHVRESAGIVAKLVGFSKQERTLKETLGLTLTPPRPRRRSWWKHGRAPLS